MRTYGDLSARARRASPGTVLRTTTPTSRGGASCRADGSLAKGERQRALLEAEGVPFVGARVDLRVARIPHDV